MKDNLFDKRVTFLDFVKLVLLVASLFSTWHIIDLITPNGPFDFVRILAFVIVVEGSLIGFERATMYAKTALQESLATAGYFGSLAVIGVFMLVSGFLEFSGPALLTTPLGTWVGVSWTVNEVVTIFALVTVVAWVVGLATISRLFALADPDKQAGIQRNKTNGKVQTERNNAFDKAMDIAKGELSIQSALLSIEHDYSSDLTPVQMAEMKRNVEAALRAQYQPVKPSAAAPVTTATSAPLLRPVRPVVLTPSPAPAASGNGHNHPTP